MNLSLNPSGAPCNHLRNVHHNASWIWSSCCQVSEIPFKSTVRESVSLIRSHYFQFVRTALFIQRTHLPVFLIGTIPILPPYPTYSYFAILVVFFNQSSLFQSQESNIGAAHHSLTFDGLMEPPCQVRDTDLNRSSITARCIYSA